MTSILMVMTSHAALGDTGKSTGWYLSEAAHPWKVFTNEGYDLTFMSPQGGPAPMDGVDLEDPINNEFISEFGDKGPETLTPGAVDATAFDVIFYVGGHGTMWDFPHDQAIASIASTIFGSGGIVAAVCHGPAGLLPIELEDGTKLIAGKQVAGFTNSEEEANGLTDVVPFLLQDALESAGATHLAGDDFESNVVIDGRLATGQNPGSATDLANAVVSLVAELASS